MSEQLEMQAELEDILKRLNSAGFTPDLCGDKEMNEMFRDCINTMSSKGKEYTGGSPDRLNNFRQAGVDVGLEMEKVWYVFFNKHLRAVQSYIKNGCKVQSNEPIQSRIMDCIVYLFLFHKMSQEIEGKRKQQ
jgi:hypothetical protein